jgi:hypothetical protein
MNHGILWLLSLVVLAGGIAAGQITQTPSPLGGATSCSAAGANWLACTISGSTLTLGATTGQAAHQVIGTSSGSTFGPISLTSADLPVSAMGTITSGVWNGSIITGTYGGTGMNNGSLTTTLSGNLTFTGAYNPTFAISSSSTWTFPSGGGTLALTGADINSSNQVTSTHLASALPFSQGRPWNGHKLRRSQLVWKQHGLHSRTVRPTTGVR